MKKKNLLLLFFTLSCFAPFFAKAQVYEKGNFIIDGYYGFPNLLTSTLKRVLKDKPEIKEVDVSSMGPMGGKLEYLLSKRIGLGLNINYAFTGVSGIIQNNNARAYTYSALVSRFRILPTLSIHMGKSERLDPYFSFSLGYLRLKFVDASNDPNYSGIAGYTNEIGEYLLNPIPVAGRVEFGVRYFFDDNIGIHGQVGIGGGPPLAAGLSFKF